MFINRKNDGTVKMTRQRAKSYHSGMTGDNNALGRDLETGGQPTPKQEAAEKLHELQQSEPVGTCTAYLRTARVTYKLCFLGKSYWWVKKEPHGTSKSLRYGGRGRAMFAFNSDKITWIEFFPANEEVNDCALPWTSWTPEEAARIQKVLQEKYGVKPKVMTRIKSRTSL
jgi:hypothetical protein